jgi:hypothetical protein
VRACVRVCGGVCVWGGGGGGVTGGVRAVYITVRGGVSGRLVLHTDLNKLLTARPAAWRAAWRKQPCSVCTLVTAVEPQLPCGSSAPRQNRLHQSCCNLPRLPACLPLCSCSTDSASSSSSSDPASLATSQRVQLGPVPGWQAELLSDALLGFGAQSVVVEEYRGAGQQEQERFGAEAELWDSCGLLAHFAIEVRPGWWDHQQQQQQLQQH